MRCIPTLLSALISSTVHVYNHSVAIIFANISSTIASTLLTLHINKDNMFLNEYTKIRRFIAF